MAAAVLASCLAVGCTSDDGDEVSETTAADLFALNAEDRPNIPVVVPITLPEGFRYQGATTNGSIVSHQYLNFEVGWVDVCVYPPSVDVVGACIPTAQPDMPVLSTAKFDGFLVAVVIAGGVDDDLDPDRFNAWRDIQLTDQLDPIDWVREPLDQPVEGGSG